MKIILLDKILLILLGIVTFLFLSIGINKPLNGHHDYNNRFFSTVAKNYWLYPVSVTKLGQLISYDQTGQAQFYTHHPILLPITLAISIGFLGYQPWTIRLVPIVFSVATICIFYLLLRKFFTVFTSFISVLFSIVTPMFLYFGKMANHEALTLFFIIAVVYFYICFKQTGLVKFWKISLVFLFLGQWAGWPEYYLACILFLFERKKSLVIISLANFSVYLLHVFLMTGSIIGGGLFEILLFRMGFGKLDWVVEQYTNLQLLKQETQWSYHFFNPIQFILTWISVAYFGFLKVRNFKFDLSQKVYITFLAVATIHVLFFRTGAWRHDYWLYYFLPFYSFAIAWGYTKLNNLIEKKRVLKIAVQAIIIILLVVSFYQGQPFFWALQNMVVKE